MFGFDREVLVPYLDYDHAKEFLKDTTREQWEETPRKDREGNETRYPLSESFILPEFRAYCEPKKRTHKKGTKTTMMRVTAPAGSKDILYGQPPYGWKLTKDRSKLVKDQEEQRVISMVRHMYFNRRLPMRAIVEEMKTMGVKNRRGNAFPLSRVCEILHTDGKPEEAKDASAKKPKKRAA